MSRRLLQRSLVALLGALVLVVGARSVLASHDAEVRVERVHHGQAHTVTVDLVSTTTATARDILFDESFDVREGGELLVDLSSENVTVRTVSGTRARVTVEGRGRNAASEFERRRFTAYTTADSLVVRTPPRRNGWMRGNRNARNARFQVTVEIPRRTSVEVDLGSGDVEVASLQGSLTVDTGSGDIEVADVGGGEIVLDTGSGDVRAGALRGRVRVDTGSGDVEIDRVDGSLWVDTGSGSVAVGQVDGPVEVDTGSGSVEIVMRSAASADVSTGSGSVTMRLPRGADFDLDADGGSVRIDEGLSFSGDRDRDEARGRIGRGGPELRLNTGSGSIRLVQS